MELWIARDKDGDLYLYTKKPEKYVQEGFFGGISGPDMDVCGIDRTSFPSVTWENSPQKVTVELAEPKRELTNTAISTEVSTEASEALNAPENPILSRNIDEFCLSVRALNCLSYVGIHTVGDLVKYQRSDLRKLRNFGERSLNEIEDFLTEHGLTFGMKV